MILPYEIDLDDRILGVDNVFVSITVSGYAVANLRDLALWHIADGQCLQTRHERNDGVVGAVQHAKVLFI